MSKGKAMILSASLSGTAVIIAVDETFAVSDNKSSNGLSLISRGVQSPIISQYST